ncbi:MAG TPA: hypothetical protein VGL72_29640 [Bryobacteraceae bacterium]
MDYVATQNFHNVDRVLASIDVRAIDTARKLGDREAARQLLRYSAGETNRYLFEQWEWTELFLGLLLLGVLVLCRTNPVLAMACCIAMMAIVAVQRFELTPAITTIGRELEFSAAASRRFAAFHAAYRYVEIAKLLLGVGLIVRLLIRPRASKKAFVREYEREARPREA